MKIDEFAQYVKSDYFVNLIKNLSRSYDKSEIYPNKKDVFRIFRNSDPKNIKVVILGQDPYTTGHANGYAFANNDDAINLSPSLNKIFKCIETQYDTTLIDPDVTLENWVRQGVFLYNTALTVQKGMVNSHLEIWNDFTKFIINFIIDNNAGVIFCLWGNKSQHAFNSSVKTSKKNFYEKLTCPHPAYACDNNIDWNCTHFKQVNEIIEGQNGKEFCIKWE